MNLSIISECYVDTNLIETIVPSLNNCNHHKGCTNVARLMSRGKLSDKFAVGIIDKDKREINYLNEFELQIKCDNLQLLRHKAQNKHHYFILIKPAMEKWILNSAAQTGILLTDFNLPTDFNTLKRKTKKITSKHNQDLKNLFHELKRKGSKNVAILSEWIEYLKIKKYNVNMNELRKATKKLSNNPKLK